jgi:hypothetical protein
MVMDAKDGSSFRSPNPFIKPAQDPKPKSPFPVWAPESSPFTSVHRLAIDDSGFRTAQQPAVDAITQFMKDHPNQQIPSHLINEPLVEIQSLRGWCLIGYCGVARRKQKIDPANNASERTRLGMRLDRLFDHVREWHFRNKRFKCDHWCASHCHIHSCIVNAGLPVQSTSLVNSIVNAIVELTSILVHVVINGSADRATFNDTSEFATKQMMVK